MELQEKVKLMTANVWADVFGNPVPGRDTALARMVIRRPPGKVLSFLNFCIFVLLST